MTALLYVSYSSKLSKDEKWMIDEQVSKNRKTVYLFVKDKTKKASVVIFLAGALCFNNPQPFEAIGLSILPTNQEVLKLVNSFRGGSSNLLGATAVLGLIILMF
uniref:Uncharacterized protein n=1 Tax=Climaconeis cf. scalaris TaxID=2846828 RepID=A0A8F8X8A8_9STRA|nr:hypothetical protein [Climaconeis cf. scalaris]